MDLTVSSDGPALTLTLNRPHRKNALTAEMVAGIIEAVNAATVDDLTRVIVLRGTGADFCAGFDLGESNSGERARRRPGHLQRGFQQGPHRMIECLANAQLPVVAGVRGWAAGIGNTLALSADVVIAAHSAKFWVPFVTKGFTPDSGNTYLLPRLVGLARAKQMIMRGQPVNGAQAAEWGLVGEVVDDRDLDARVDEVAAEFAAAATVSVGLAKNLIHRNLEVGLTSALHNEGIYEELAVRTDDFKEGIRSFVERRPPDYRGR